MTTHHSPSAVNGDSSPGGADVLVVDDEPTLRMGFRLALLTEGHRVEMAQDGEDALSQIGARPFDVMVLDLRMPGIDGIGVLRQLASADETLPVIIASAHMDDAVVREALRLGSVDFLSKPVRPDDLREITNRVIAEEEQFTSPSDERPVPALARARCLLRRRRPSAARAELARSGGDAEGVSLWTRVADLVQSGPDDPDAPNVSLPELLDWSSPRS